MGYADILLKVPGRSKFGDWSYEVQDTKLAQNTRAATILQLCLYTELLSDIQGSVPEKMYVVKPGENFPSESYRFADFQAYYNTVKQDYERGIAQADASTYPDNVSIAIFVRGGRSVIEKDMTTMHCPWWPAYDRYISLSCKNKISIRWNSLQQRSLLQNPIVVTWKRLSVSNRRQEFS